MSESAPNPQFMSQDERLNEVRRLISMLPAGPVADRLLTTYGYLDRTLSDQGSLPYAWRWARGAR